MPPVFEGSEEELKTLAEFIKGAGAEGGEQTSTSTE